MDLSQSRLPPYAHQVMGVEALIKWNEPEKGRVYPGCFALFDEMGAGKTKQVIDAAQVLFQEDTIDTAIIIAPAPVRDVWFDEELGELAKHLWLATEGQIVEYHAKLRSWQHGPKPEGRYLKFIITNYDYIRREEHRAVLLRVCSPRVILVLDESSAIKNYKAQQTKACIELRKACGWVWLLNGTPIANSPEDMFSQGRIMDPRILDCKTYYHFRARYAVMGGWQQKQIVNWVNLDDMQRRFAPYVLRRLKSQCLDLPEKLSSVAITATLSEAIWKVYKEMRDEMVAWLSETTVSVAPQAIVKALRLSQLTSGFLGGIEESEGSAPAAIQELGREKLDVFLEWYRDRLREDPNLKLLVWCRFRAELDRLAKSIPTGIAVGRIWGGQKHEERDEALRLLDPRTTPPGPVVVVGTPASGSMGLNLTAAHTVVYLSNDYSLKTRLQSEDRVHRPGQRNVVSYFDVIAVGPKGQKTIDATIVKALRDKNDLASWTTAAWVAALRESETE